MDFRADDFSLDQSLRADQELVAFVRIPVSQLLRSKAATLRKLPQSLREQKSKIPPALATTLLLLLVARLLVELVGMIVAPSEHWSPTPVAAPPQPAKVDIDTIMSANLFGRFEAPATKAANETPPVQMNLNLIGIMYFKETERASRALIAVGDKDAKPFAAGDELSQGVLLTGIESDYVDLSTNGQHTKLKFKRDEASTALLKLAGAEVDSDEENGIVSRNPNASFSEIRSKVIKDPLLMDKYLMTIPMRVNGKLTGYKIFPGQDRSLFNDADLLPGDLLTSINGKMIADNDNPLQLVEEIRKASKLSMVVERAGKTQSIKLQ